MDLSNYFLQPQNLAALAGLLALIVFYLVKKKPETQVMPSMAFFMEKEKEGTIQHALRQLLHNLVLLLQVLIVLGLAAALAHPYLEQPTTSEKSVIILDNSASMSNNMAAAKEFAKDNLGETNTLILANDNSEVIRQGASGAATENAIENVKAVDTATDLSSALQTAQNYEGQVVLASDLDDSYREIDVAERLTEAERNFKTMETQPENKAGIVDIEVSRDTASADIKNFLSDEREVSYTINGNQSSVTIPGNAVETVKFTPQEGRNKLEIEYDEMTVDNTGYAYVPEQRNFKAVLISDSGNSYFEKAIELIDFMDLETVRPPLGELPEADVYVVGETERVLSSTLDKVENKVREGDSLIVFGQTGINELGLESVPAEVQGGWQNETVEIREPVKTSLQTKVLEARKTNGDSYSRPREAVIQSKYGIGDVLFYNIQDEDFRSNFLYPVFWKKNLAQMTERPTVSERNIETGDLLNASKITTPSGKEKSLVEVEETGFYNTSRGVYAANLLNEEESSEEASAADSSIGEDTEQRDIQNLVTVIVLLLMVGEAAYLRRLGEL